MKLNKFSERLIELRKEKSLTQLQLANDLGFSRTAISDWESRNREPAYDTLIKVANYFSVSLDYLLGREDY